MKHTALQPLFSADRIRAETSAIARRITADYRACSPVVLGVLKGACIFLADLVRLIPLEISIEFVQAASYGAHTVPAGDCCLQMPANLSLTGRDVLIVEDIVDTGQTLQKLRQELQRHCPNSLRCCALIDKTARRTTPVIVEYACFQIESAFVVGYGLDYNGRYRAFPDIYAMRTDDTTTD